jgi:hypothetical protein
VTARIRFTLFACMPLMLVAQTAHYGGSVACKNCHRQTFERWKKTHMAKVVRDPTGSTCPPLRTVNSAPSNPASASYFASSAYFSSGRCFEQKRT